MYLPNKLSLFFSVIIFLHTKNNSLFTQISGGMGEAITNTYYAIHTYHTSTVKKDADPV
jgi:hypothetical protein